MVKRMFLPLILFFICSCQNGSVLESIDSNVRGMEWVECQLMDYSDIEFSSDSGLCTVKSIKDENEPVRLYGVVCPDGSVERTSQSECYYDNDSQIQSRIFSSASWLTVKAHAGSGSPYAELLDVFTLEVEQNTSGSKRACSLLFVTFYKKQIITIIQE